MYPLPGVTMLMALMTDDADDHVGESVGPVGALGAFGDGAPRLAVGWLM